MRLQGRSDAVVKFFYAAVKSLSMPASAGLIVCVMLAMISMQSSLFAGNDSDPQSYWLQQRAIEDQKHSKPPEAKPSPRRPIRDFVPGEATRTPGAPGGVPIEPKFFVTVVGDSLAVQIADGLQDAFLDKPDIAVQRRARDSSGLVRDDYYDWVKAAHEISEKDKSDVIVIVIGSNDLQSLKDGAETVDPLSDKWKELYSQRIEAFIAPFRSSQSTVLWLGLPPMRNDAYNADVAKLNEIYRQTLENSGVKYVDIWEAFADDDGSYDAFGPDISGQNAKLRAADGIHFTKAGARKAAGFLESEIRRVYDSASPKNEIAALPPDIEQAAIDINAQIRQEAGLPPRTGAMIAPPVAPKPAAGPIFSLTSAPLAEDGMLARRRVDSDQAMHSELNANTSPSKGGAANARKGRSDDFVWPRS
jgi:hypothetical protein